MTKWCLSVSEKQNFELVIIENFSVFEKNLFDII